MSSQRTVAGQRVLLVEDNFLAAQHLTMMLEDLGMEIVGIAASVVQGIEMARESSFDLGILDVSIIGGDSTPIADVLTSIGRPFVFCTGYSAPKFASDDWAFVPVLRKPIDETSLETNLVELCAESLTDSHEEKI